MTGAQKEAMLATLAMVREKWGSMEAYAKDFVGVDEATLQKLRAGLTVDAHAS